MKKLLELSNVVRTAISEGKKLSCTELEDLNFVLDMMVRGWPTNEGAVHCPFPPKQERGV